MSKNGFDNLERAALGGKPGGIEGKERGERVKRTWKKEGGRGDKKLRKMRLRQSKGKPLSQALFERRQTRFMRFKKLDDVRKGR